MLEKMNEMKAKFDEMTAGKDFEAVEQIRKDINKESLADAVKVIVSSDKKSIDLIKLFDGVQYVYIDSNGMPTVAVVKPSQAIAMKDSAKTIKYPFDKLHGDLSVMLRKLGANLVLANSTEKGVKVAPEYTNYVPRADFFNGENRASRSALEKQLQAVVNTVYGENDMKVKKIYVDALMDLFITRAKSNTDTRDRGEKDLMDCIQVVIWDIKTGKQYKHNSKLSTFTEPKDAPKKK